MTTGPSPYTYRPLPLRHCTRTHTPVHTRNAMRHWQSAHREFFHDIRPSSVGIVPDRELPVRPLMEMCEAEGEPSAGTGAGNGDSTTRHDV